ncbi:hypothetical protein [Actinomadura sp. GTD37]|uniref:hypothetical protein n=1 Tax=Actinomadura sp. GTD37 TaxID=1778030 RepID=UPI0035C0A65B
MPVLLRLAAVAGFVFAGWLALSALSDPAFAAERPAPHPAQADATGPSTLRHFTAGPGVRRAMTDAVREAGDDPVRYVRSRRHDLFHDKDQAVRQVRELADRAGVPHVRIPDVRRERPVIRDLVHRATDPRPAQRPAAHQRPEEHGDAGAPGRAASEDEVSAARRTDAAAGTSAGTKADDCPRCGGGHRAPAHSPAVPGQDAPQGGGGSTGGHPLTPVADLPSRRSPAAPPAVYASTFPRTALTDVAAPGGPSVVPD